MERQGGTSQQDVGVKPLPNRNEGYCYISEGALVVLEGWDPVLNWKRRTLECTYIPGQIVTLEECTSVGPQNPLRGTAEVRFPRGVVDKAVLNRVILEMQNAEIRRVNRWQRLCSILGLKKV